MDQEFLAEFKTAKPTFKAEAFYNEHGDCIDYQTVDEPFYGDRLNSLVTVYRSMRDRRVIGFLVKGVRRILQTIDCNIMAIGTAEDANGSIAIIRIVMAAMEVAAEEPTEEQREALNAIIQSLGDQSLPIRRAA